MADRDSTDSPAERVNKPTEEPRSLCSSENGTSGYSSGNSGPNSITNMNSLRCHSKIPDIIAGSAVYERGHYKSDRVEHAQKEMLDKLKSRKSQTSGGFAPNVDEQLCEKKCLKIRDIDPRVFRKACNWLNIPQQLGRDWKDLAGELGKTVMDVKVYECEKDPSGSMLCAWDNEDNDNNVQKLVEALRKINRQDVIQLFQDEIDKKGKS